MSTRPGSLRLVAVVLGVVLLATVVAPAPALAFDLFNPYVAIASAGVALIILGTYLVVANVRDSRTAAGDGQWTSVAVMGPASSASGQWTSLAVMGKASDGNGGWAEALEAQSPTSEASAPRVEQGP